MPSELRSGRRLSAPAVCAISLAAFVALIGFNLSTFWHQTDAVVYRDAGAALWAHDGNLYTSQFGPAHLPLTYTPFAAVMFSIGSGLPFHDWQCLLAAGDIGLLLFAVSGALRVAGSKRLFTPTMYATAICLWLEPLDMTFHFGQINILIVALVVLDFSGLSRGRWSGIGVGIASGIKLTPLVFIPYFWMTGRKREAYGSAGFFGATVAVGAILRPHDSWSFWSGRLFKAGDDPTRIQDQSINGFLRRLSPHGSAIEVAWILLALAVGIVGLMIAAAAYREGLRLTGLTACAGTGLAISPLTWTHHYAYIVLAIALALSNELDLKARVGLGLVATVSFAWWPWPNANNWGAHEFHMSGLLRLVPSTSGKELHWGVLETICGNYYLWAILAFLAFAHRMTTNRRRLSRDIAGSGSTRTPAPLPAVDFKPLRRTPDQTPSGRRR